MRLENLVNVLKMQTFLRVGQGNPSTENTVKPMDSSTPVAKASHTDAFTLTPSLTGRNYDGSLTSSKRFSSTKHSSARKASSIQSLPTPLTARLSRIPVPLLQSGIGDLLLDMSRAHASSTSTASLPHFVSQKPR